MSSRSARRRRQVEQQHPVEAAKVALPVFVEPEPEPEPVRPAQSFPTSIRVIYEWTYYPERNEA